MVRFEEFSEGKHKIIEIVQKWTIEYWKRKFVSEMKCDEFVDITLYHKDFEDYIAIYKQFKSYDEAMNYIRNFISNELQ